MNILAVDTSCNILSLAVASEGIIRDFSVESGMYHSQLLIDSVQGLLDSAGLKPQELEGIVCTGGPGSFTGLRIGFAFAKGLALALDIPFVPVSGSKCVFYCSAARLAEPSRLVVSVFEAGKTGFFCGFFSGNARLGKEIDAKPDEIAFEIASILALEKKLPYEKAVLTGPGAEKLFNTPAIHKADNVEVESCFEKNYAKALLDIAQNDKILENDSGAWLFRGPEYVRESDAENNRKRENNAGQN